MAKYSASNTGGTYWGPINYMNRFVLVPLSTHLNVRKYAETTFKIYPLNIITILDEMEYVQSAPQFKFFVSLYLNDAIHEIHASLYDTTESPYILIVAKSNRGINDSHLHGMMATGKYQEIHRAHLFSPSKIGGYDYVMHYECSLLSAMWHPDAVACDPIDGVTPDDLFMMNSADDIRQVYTCTITSPDCAPGAIYPEAINQRRSYVTSETETEVLTELAALDRVATLSDILAIIAVTTPNIITHIAMDIDTVFRDTVDFAASEFGGMLGSLVENHTCQYIIDPNVTSNFDNKTISFNIINKASSFFDLPYHQLSPYHFCIGKAIAADEVKFSSIMDYIGRTYSTLGYAILVNGIHDDCTCESVVLPNAPGAVYLKGHFDTYAIEMHDIYDRRIITEEEPRIIATTRAFGTLIKTRSTWGDSMFESLEAINLTMCYLSDPITINPERVAHLESDMSIPFGDEIIATHFVVIPKEKDNDETHARIRNVFADEMGYSRIYKIGITSIVGDEAYLIGVLASELGSDEEEEEEYTGTLHLQTNFISEDSKIVFQGGNGTLIADSSVSIHRPHDKASIPTDNISEPEKPGLVASLLDKIRSKINESKNNESTH